MINPPKGFLHLGWAIERLNQPYDVIGVCVDYLEATKSRGTDFTIQFKLHDPSWIQDHGMKFRFFSKAVEKLPKIQAPGDVLILRNVLTKTFNNQLIGMSTTSTSWAVLSGSSIVESSSPDGSDITFVTSNTGFDTTATPNAEQLKYAKEIVSMEDPTSYRPPPKSTALEIENIMIGAGGTPQERKNKWRLIKDLNPNTSYGGNAFADIFGEVRKSWYNDFGRVELSVTDYTTNKLLYNHPEESQTQGEEDYGYLGALHGHWPGPWGRMTISILLYDAHAAFAKSNIKPGMYVLIKNCHIKLDPNETKLEAVCRGDRTDMSKVNLSIYNPRQIADDQRFKDLLMRRLEYEKSARTKGLRFSLDKPGQDTKKHKLETLEVLEAVSTKDKTDLEERLKSKRRKKRGAKQTSEVVNGAITKSSEPTIASNQYVRCNKIDVPLKSITDILDPSILARTTPTGTPYTLPFQNCSYKTKVRVVDYYPPDLTSFCVPHLVTDYDALSDIEATQNEDTTLVLTAAQSNPHSVRWEWRFFLIVEDAISRPPGPQMALLVAGDDGDFLLNQEACDLSADTKELAKIREKLFVLWGNLQERKEEALAKGTKLVKAQSRPFECFIKEYGVPIPIEDDGDGGQNTNEAYQRMFRMFGTSI